MAERRHVSLIQTGHLNRQIKCDRGSSLGSALNITFAMDFRQPEFHVGDSLAGFNAVGTSWIHVDWQVWSKSPAIVANGKNDALGPQRQGYPHLISAGVFDNIVQGLLEGQEQIMPCLRHDRQRRQLQALRRVLLRPCNPRFQCRQR